MQLLKKIEELTLYTIQQEQTIGSQQQAIQELVTRVSQLEQRQGAIGTK